MDGWGFAHKSCAFVWTKANVSQIEMFRDDADPDMLLGYWTRANTEFCLLGTRGKPKRVAADVRQAIIEPRREHSRKPDCVHERIERLVAGPYCELFARQSTRPGWDFWGAETEKFNAPKAAPMPKNFNPAEPIEDLEAHFAAARKLKVASPFS